MAHLIETINHLTIREAIQILQKTQNLIVDRVILAQNQISVSPANWGTNLKRLNVSLPKGEELIGKSSERFVEIINIMATTERTISALLWLSLRYPDATVKECHASTSDVIGGNDIVLLDANNQIIVRCEVTDVVSNKAGQNGKEKKDLKTLGCEFDVPQDGVHRYIATSNEFALALTSVKRKWAFLHYRYALHHTDCRVQTALLEIIGR